MKSTHMQIFAPLKASCRNGTFALELLTLLLLCLVFMLFVGCSRCVGTYEAVQVPIGEFFLVRRGNACAAVKLLPPGGKQASGRHYVWFYQEDGSGIFTNAAARSGKGYVSENYETITDPGEPHRELLVLDGAAPNIQCGGIRLEWSSGDWVYFRDYYGMFKDIEIALTTASSIEEVDYLSSHLEWQRGKEHR